MTEEKLNIISDREITIAQAKSYTSEHWKNRKLKWSEFVSELSKTYRTNETVEQFKNADKPNKTKIKNCKGGFVGGALKQDGIRNKNSIKSRSLLTLDIDNCSSLASLESSITALDVESCLYSTHSHREDYLRFRLIILLNRDVTPEEYEPLSRMVASKLDIEIFDTTTHQAERLMFLPSTPKDGEYIFKQYGAEALNVDEVLAEYTFGWQDRTTWPISKKEIRKIKSDIEKQEDPLTKKGIIGAFCRTYTITEAIEEFLSDIYKLSDDGARATYIPGSTSNGVVIYDDKFSYSHHGTDPTSNILCNAWDLVRIHKFSDLDDNVRKNTKPNNYPSFKEMRKLALKDKEVVKTQELEKQEQLKEEFGSIEIDENIDNSWKTKLTTNENGDYVASRDNIKLIALNDSNLKDRIYFDSFQKLPKIKKPLFWSNKEEFGEDQNWSDTDDSYLRSYLEKYYNIRAKDNIYNDAMNMFFSEVAVHPIRQYLNSLLWDGELRVETIFMDYLGANDTEYNRMVAKKTLVAAVKRIFEPGCKYEELPILASARQGIGKSTLLEKLGSKWYSDSLRLEDIKISIKKAMEQTEGSWIIELGEVKGISSKDADIIKSFLSGKSDKARRAYGRRVSIVPRSFIIIGTTNNQELLSDRTGNRRYLPVTTDENKPNKDIFKIEQYEIDQIWAEAFYYYQEGYSTYLNKKEKELAAEEQEIYSFTSEEEERFIEYINKPVIAVKGNGDWYSLPLEERLNYLYPEDSLNRNNQDRQVTEKRKKVCVRAIYEEFYNHEYPLKCDELTRELENSIKSSLIKAGWRKYTKNDQGKLKFGVYGKRVAFVKN